MRPYVGLCQLIGSDAGTDIIQVSSAKEFHKPSVTDLHTQTLCSRSVGMHTVRTL